MNRSLVEQFLEQLSRAMPKDLAAMQTGMKRQWRTALSATFAKMDLVTREQFDVQSKLLSRTRQRLEQMKARLDRLENREQ